MLVTDFSTEVNGKNGALAVHTYIIKAYRKLFTCSNGLWQQSVSDRLIVYTSSNIVQPKSEKLQLQKMSKMTIISLLSYDLAHVRRASTCPVFSSKCFCNCSKEYCNRSPITLHPRDSTTISPNFPPRFRTFFTGSVE